MCATGVGVGTCVAVGVGVWVGVGVARERKLKSKDTPESRIIITAIEITDAAPSKEYFIALLFFVKKTLVSLDKRLKKPDILINKFFIKSNYNKAAVKSKPQ
jgi:hypothetical protein